ncbi:hypothetical protein DITRI_Ditri09bG0092700 [Diplodiscus trichospermus]
MGFFNDTFLVPWKTLSVREDRPPNSKFFPGSFNLVDYDKSCLFWPVKNGERGKGGARLQEMGFVATYVLMLLCLNIFTHSFCNRIHNFTCIESEKQALLKFKYDLKDPSNMLAVWSSNVDCCNWFGVVCDNATGHVTELHLGRSKLGGKLNPSLLELTHLSQLNLSYNDFEQIQIPVWFWNLTSRLQYLNISGNQFQGKIPDLLITRHASVVLDFCSNNFTGPLPLISFNVTVLDVSTMPCQDRSAIFCATKSTI